LRARDAVAGLVLTAGCAGAMRAPPPPPDLGTLTLDRADPVVEARIDGIAVRLGVALNAADTLEVGPETAVRFPSGWWRGTPQDIGRVRLPSRERAAAVESGGATMPLTVSTHDLPCCDGHDGSVSPMLLPWSVVRLGTVPAGLVERRWPVKTGDVAGPFVPMETGAGRIQVLINPRATTTVATAAAGAMLAETYGAHFEGEARDMPIALGVMRPVRDLVFDRPVPVLGFSVRRLAVRYADFAGNSTLPQDQGDEIVVRKRGPRPQYGWPAVIVGADLLDACPAIATYRAGPELGLACR
jgi:hypothetical protein